MIRVYALSTVVTTFLLLNAGRGTAPAAEAGPSSNTHAELPFNGNVETAASNGSGPANWSTPEGVPWLEEDGGNHFPRLQAVRCKLLTVYRLLPVGASHKALKLTYRMRTNALMRGEQIWHRMTGGS